MDAVRERTAIMSYHDIVRKCVAQVMKGTYVLLENKTKIPKLRMLHTTHKRRNVGLMTAEIRNYGETRIIISFLWDFMCRPRKAVCLTA